MLQVFTIALLGMLCVAGLASAPWALALICLMYALEQSLQASSPIFLAMLSLANFIVAIAAGLSMGVSFARTDRPMQGYWNFALVGSLAIYCWSMLSLIWTPSFEAAWGMISWGIPYCIVFLVVAPLLLDGIASVGVFARAFLYGGSLVVLSIVINPEFVSFGGRMALQLEGKVRTNPLAIGELGGCLIIVAALLRQGPRQGILQVGRIAAFCLGAILALQSGSRGQLLFAVVIALLFYPLSKKLKSIATFFGTALGVVIIVPAVLFLASTVLQTEGLRRWDMDNIDSGTVVRILNATDLLMAMASQPFSWIFGMGANAFSSLSSATASEGYVHNITAETLAELGLPIFILFVAIIWKCGRDAIWLFRRFAASPVERASLSVLLALAAYQLLLANKQGNLWSNQTPFLYMILIARLQRRTAARDEEDRAIPTDVQEGEDETMDSKPATQLA